MVLSSAYITEQLQKKYRIAGQSGISGEDGYMRPFFLEGSRRAEEEHIYIVTEEMLIGKVLHIAEGMWIFCGSTCPKTLPEPYLWINGTWNVAEESGEYLAGCVLNSVQMIFDCCENWENSLKQQILEGGELQRMLQISSEFLRNPLLVMGLDFTLLGQAGTESLPERYRLYHEDGIDMDYMNSLLQSEEYHKLEDSHKTELFPGSISGIRSLNHNIYPRERKTCRVVMQEWNRSFTDGDYCLMEILATCLELMLSHSNVLEEEDEISKIFEKILKDRTADYMEMSRRLSVQGWSSQHIYLCLILQLTYLNQKNLSTNAICHYIRKQFPHSSSFLFQGEIVTFFNLTLLDQDEDEIGSTLTYFIRDSYLKAGYSRSVRGHMYFRRQFVQARTALDVGGRKKPYLWIHHFDQVALTYIIEQVTRRLPASMVCHTGLLKLREMDEQGQSEYMRTLRIYLEQNLNATRSAEELFIHRSTFLYRLEKIKEILQSELDDPEEIFYLNLSFRLLEQEDEEVQP